MAGLRYLCLKVVSSINWNMWLGCVTAFVCWDGVHDSCVWRVQIVRCNPEPFGGLRLVLCGDCLQLPPIDKKGGGSFVYSCLWVVVLILVTLFLGARFCFEAASWSRCVDVQIELTQVVFEVRCWSVARGCW